MLQWSYMTDYVPKCIVKDVTKFGVIEFVPCVSKLTQDELYGTLSSDWYDTACISCITIDMLQVVSHVTNWHDTSCITY